MSSRRTAPIGALRGAATLDRVRRLDLLVNPHGPSIRVQEALACAEDLHLPSEGRAAELQSRIAAMVGVPYNWLVLGNGFEELFRTILTATPFDGQVVTFPPSDVQPERIAGQLGREVYAIPRSHRFAVELDLEACAEIPLESVAFVMTPNDPTGACLSVQDAVRLSRSCQLVIIDERHGDYSGRTLLPLVREFDNLVVVQTFETWAGLSGFPLAYAIAPPALAGHFNCRTREQGIAMGSVIAAMATLDDLVHVRRTVARVREEKSRLYRTLRKLNMISPLPSWANFVLAKVERGDRDYFARELAARDILVYSPPQPELENYLRISARSAEDTMALKQALIEAALPL